MWRGFRSDKERVCVCVKWSHRLLRRWTYLFSPFPLLQHAHNSSTSATQPVNTNWWCGCVLYSPIHNPWWTGKEHARSSQWWKGVCVVVYATREKESSVCVSGTEVRPFHITMTRTINNVLLVLPLEVTKVVDRQSKSVEHTTRCTQRCLGWWSLDVVALYSLTEVILYTYYHKWHIIVRDMM